MRLVRLKLRSNIIWSLPPVHLVLDVNDTSPLIDVDLLTDSQKNVIQGSRDQHEIYILDSYGNKLNSLGNLETIDGNSISFDDIEEDEDTVPQMISVTDDFEEEEEEQKTIPIPIREDFENADVILKNGVTVVKKTILALEKSEDTLKLLYACFDRENANKKRSSIISFLEKQISEY